MPAEAGPNRSGPIHRGGQNAAERDPRKAIHQQTSLCVRHSTVNLEHPKAANRERTDPTPVRANGTSGNHVDISYR